MRPHPLFSLVAVAAAIACSEPTYTAPTSGPQRADSTFTTPNPAMSSVWGTVAVPDGESTAYLQTSCGLIALQGDTELVRRVKGSLIVAYGTYAGCGSRSFQLVDFEVKWHDGMTAWDGILDADGQGYILRLRDRTTHRLVEPPAALTVLFGSRVWVAAASNESAPSAFGLIQ